MERDDFSELVKAAAFSGMPSVSEGFEGRVMLEVARLAIEEERRKARFSLAVSLTGTAIAAAACITAVVLWFPDQILLSIDLDTVINSVISGIRALLP